MVARETAPDDNALAIDEGGYRVDTGFADGAKFADHGILFTSPMEFPKVCRLMEFPNVIDLFV